jgi:hypothetical protein
MTPKAAIRLAKACPNLRDVRLQDSGAGSEAALLAFFRSCQKLHTFENTGGGSFPVSLFNQLASHPELAPRLKVLRIDSSTQKGFMKNMKALSKARPRMKITLQSQSEIKKHGDWELQTYNTTYKKGQKFVERLHMEEMMYGYW